MSDPSTLTATEAARRLRAGSLSASALCEALLARIAAREGWCGPSSTSIRRRPCVPPRRRMPPPPPAGPGRCRAWPSA
ncbi:hypothetical protein ACFQY5_02135 [Paeniroseomonas aquatica]|uniref:hypothetical protein n=1 Tax=Paeniroseomonas aquatica TaxID=373043 RepID=UPI0036177045